MITNTWTYKTYIKIFILKLPIVSSSSPQITPTNHNSLSLSKFFPFICGWNFLKLSRFGLEWFNWKVFRIANIIACRPCSQSRTRVASRQRSKRNSNATFRIGHVTARSLQYLSTALSSHVYLCHIRHVILHARQEKEWHRRRLQFWNIRPEYDIAVSSKQSEKNNKRIKIL